MINFKIGAQKQGKIKTNPECNSNRRRSVFCNILLIISIFTLSMTTLNSILLLYLDHSNEHEIVEEAQYITDDLAIDNIADHAVPDLPSDTRATEPRGTRGFFDTWGMTAPTITNLDEPNKNTIYAGFKPYTFEFLIDDFMAFSTVSSVRLDIDDEEGNYTWTQARSGTEEQVIEGRSTYTTSMYKISPDTGFLYFNVTFGWENSNESSNHLCNITIIETDTDEFSTEIWLDYRLVRNVKFIGDMMVEAESQGLLNEYDWVRKLENITWTGLKIVYDTPNNYMPPRTHAKILLFNDNGTSWVDTSPEGNEMIIVSVADHNNDYTEIHTLNITGPAKHTLLASIEFTYRVDADGIYFYNATPKPSEWLNSTTVKCNISISDNATSGVDSNSIEFSFSGNGGTSWSQWYKPLTLSSNSITRCQATIEFQEGTQNLIRWRGKDVVKNALSYSKNYKISVDTEMPIFKNPLPSVSELQFNTMVNCSIEIVDDISGINLSSIEYSIKPNGEDNWTYWKNIGILGIKNSIKANTKAELDYGLENYIKWRVRDVAGNGYTESEINQIRITHDIAKVYLITPAPGSTLNLTKPTLRWNDSYDMIQQVTYTLEYWEEGDKINATQINLTQVGYTILNPLKFNTKYYWQVIPKTEVPDRFGICESGIWNFTVNTYENVNPKFDFETRLFIEDNIIYIKPNVEKIFTFIIFNKGNHDDTYFINVIGEEIWLEHIDYETDYFVPINGSTNVSFNIKAPKSINYSTYPIKIHVFSTRAELFNQSAEQDILIDIIVEKEKQKDSKQFAILEISVIFIVIVIIIIILVGIYLAKSKKKLEEIKKGTSLDSEVRGNLAEIVFRPEFKKAIDRTAKVEDSEVEKESEEKPRVK